MSGSSFSVATTVFVSLAICAVISYGVFYYFKQRISLIEKSQMEQARIMQAIISRGLHGPPPSEQQLQAQQVQQQAQQVQHHHNYDKEITITQSSLIEVSSESDSDSESSDSSSESSNTETEEDKWSIGDEIHQPEAYHRKFEEDFKRNILLDTICIDSSFVIDGIDIENKDEHAADTKKIISLNRSALNTHNDDEDDDNDDNDDNDDDSSTSSSSDEAKEDKEDKEDKEAKEDKEDKEANEANEANEFELKIGYKSNGAKSMQLNYGNMSVPALRQLAKERGLGGDDADLQKLKKKDLVQLLQ